MLLIWGAKYLIVLPVIIGCAYFLFQSPPRKKRVFVFGLITVVLTGLIALLGGHLYYNPRPFVVGNFTPLIPHAPDNGFPSDHILLAAAIAAIISYYNWRWAAVLWILTVIIAICRIGVGVHHPIDVVGSVAIALLSSGLAYLMVKRSGISI